MTFGNYFNQEVVSMKIRESGMPEQDTWEKFFNPKQVLAMLGMNRQTIDVAEFGCGYGTFTIPAAKIVSGKVYTLDIEPDMIRATEEATKNQKVNNVQTILRDFVSQGSGLPDDSIDYVMLFNILHAEKPDILLKEANRILKMNGKIGIIHWNYDPATPRGPSMDIRPKPQQCIEWAENAGFHNPVRHDLKPYHYGIVLQKGATIFLRASGTIDS